MPQGFSLANFGAVLFDVDGTLVDSLGMIVPGLADAIERYSGSRPSESEIRSIVGLPMRTQMERYLPLPISDSEMTEIIQYTLDRFSAYVHLETIFTPAVSAMRLCKSMGLATALVTSKDSTELAQFMTRFSGADAVDVTVCASDVQHPKPAPDSALLAVAKLGVQPSQAILIGDSIFDLRCARSAGISCAGVGYGSASLETLSEEHPDLLLESPEALLQWAERSFLNRHGPQESTDRTIIDTQRDRPNAVPEAARA